MEGGEGVAGAAGRVLEGYYSVVALVLAYSLRAATLYKRAIRTCVLMFEVARWCSYMPRTRCFSSMAALSDVASLSFTAGLALYYIHADSMVYNTDVVVNNIFDSLIV